MIGPCGFAGPQCPQDPICVVRIDRVGDRAMCAAHLAWMESMGMAFRRLDEQVPVPAWRQRSLARDYSGAILPRRAA